MSTDTAIDLCIPTLPTTPERLVVRAAKSAIKAIRLSPVPVALHLVPGVPAHLGQTQRRYIEQGSFPWVARLDDDDEIHPEFFLRMAPHLGDDTDAVWCLDAGMKETNTSAFHGGHIVRRSVLQEQNPDDLRFDATIELKRRIKARARNKYVPEHLYYWRQRLDSNSSTYKNMHHKEFARERSVDHGR